MPETDAMIREFEKFYKELMKDVKYYDSDGNEIR